MKRILNIVLAMCFTLTCLPMTTRAKVIDEVYSDIPALSNANAGKISEYEFPAEGEQENMEHQIDNIDTYGGNDTETVALSMYDGANMDMNTTPSVNASANSYTGSGISKCSAVINSHIIENNDGTLTRVEYISRVGVVVETYEVKESVAGEVQYELKDKHILKCELSIFGGFYNGMNANYLVFGEVNPEENDNQEVIRVVEYGKDWNRVGHSSLYGANISIPFDGGSMRITETTEHLYIHTSRQRYTSSDGLRHQSNMTILMNKSTRELRQLGDFTVSHSFNQFIQTDGTYLFTVDHGDGSPRAVCVRREYIGNNGQLTTSIKTNVLNISGKNGDNTTGVSVGGFELSTDNCLVAGNSIDQNYSGDPSLYNLDNIFLTVTDRNLKETKTIWLTNYVDDGSEEILTTTSTPQLVKINNNKFLIMWEENGYSRTSESRLDDKSVRMVSVDGNGNILSSASKVMYRLSDCQPIVTSDGLVKWYVTEGIFSSWAGDDDPETGYSNSHVEDFLMTVYAVDSDDLHSGGVSGTFGNFSYVNGGYSITITGCDQTVSQVVIPEKINGLSVSRIADDAFSNYAKLTSVTIPDSVVSIGDRAFQGCGNLTEVQLPKGNVRIGESAFSGCKSLSGMSLPKGLRMIPEDLFNGCVQLAEVQIPDHVVLIGHGAFEGCTGLARVVVPDGVTMIGHTAFKNCASLTRIDLPDTVYYLGQWVFAGCGKLAKITLPKEAKYIGDAAFQNCTSLTQVQIPRGLREMSREIFAGCSRITDILIPEEVTVIRKGAFYDCTALSHIAIPSSVTTIGNGAFLYCDALSNILYSGSKEQWRNITVETANSPLTSATLYDSLNFSLPVFWSSYTEMSGGTCVLLACNDMNVITDEAIFYAAAYDANGRMKKVAAGSLMRSGFICELRFECAFDSSWKIFLLNKKTYSPITQVITPNVAV